MKSKIRIFLLLTIITGFAFFSSAKASEPLILQPADSIVFIDVRSLSEGDSVQHVSSRHTASDASLKKRIVSALFALPFPCGFMGTHRVMLGTSPWVPVVYVATFGGCFGLLPLIDFCFIAFSKDITPYENNPHVFMWVTNTSKQPVDP